MNFGKTTNLQLLTFSNEFDIFDKMQRFVIIFEIPTFWDIFHVFVQFGLFRNISLWKIINFWYLQHFWLFEYFLWTTFTFLTFFQMIQFKVFWIFSTITNFQKTKIDRYISNFLHFWTILTEFTQSTFLQMFSAFLPTVLI